MALFADLFEDDEYEEEEEERPAIGPHFRRSLGVSEEVGREAIKQVHETEGPSGGAFLRNLRTDVGQWATGLFAAPAMIAKEVYQEGPLDAARNIGSAVVQGYKEDFTPREDESVPGMLLRRAYEKPFSTLMDASLVAQVSTGGLGIAAKAAGMTRTAEIASAVSKRAARLDPISIALDTGRTLFRKKTADLVARNRITEDVTEQLAERQATQRWARDSAKQETNAALGGLNPAELAVFHPYTAGRFVADEWGPRVMEYTGEWVPLKGQMIRPEALEAARTNYEGIRQKFLYAMERTPAQIQETTAARALSEAKEKAGDGFDPMHPAVQDYVTNEVQAALLTAEKNEMKRATGEVRTALDLAKERAFNTKLEEGRIAGIADTTEEMRMFVPSPEPTTIREALEAMGPQGAVYFPHTGEVFGHEQSSIRNIAEKLGEASMYKDNEMALFRHGYIDQADPVKALLRTFRSLEEGEPFSKMALGALERGSDDAAIDIQRMTGKNWKWSLDPDVKKGTHQPVHLGRLMLDDLAEEEGQKMLSRLLEVSDEAGEVNWYDAMTRMVDGMEKHGPKLKGDVPVFKVRTGTVHALKALRTQMEPATTPMASAFDNLTQHWNWFTLNTRVGRIVNNVVGNTGFAAMQGVHPFSMRGMQSWIAMGRAMGAKSGLLKDATSKQYAKVFDLPGIRSGGLQAGVSAATDLGKVSEKLAKGPLPLRYLGKWGDILARTNSNIESAFRGASLFFELSPGALDRAKRAVGHGVESMALGEQIEKFSAVGQGAMKLPEYKRALDRVNRFFHNYDKATPLERRVIRNIFPYFKFAKHAVELGTRFPFEHPLKGQAMRALGDTALADVKQQLKEWGYSWEADVPPQMQQSLPLYTDEDPDTGEKRVWMYNTKGPNPFSILTGYAGEQALQMLNPIIKTAIENMTGINLFTRERFRGAVSTFAGREVGKNGQIEESFNAPGYAESFLRQFWPYQSVRELVAQGRVPTDTATLFDMATNGPGAWEYDDSGYERTRPRAFGALTPFARQVGPAPQALTPRTKQQRSSAKGIVNSQLNDMYQRALVPERERILEAIAESARIVREREE